jgi:hypothetical protein
MHLFGSAEDAWSRREVLAAGTTGFVLWVVQANSRADAATANDRPVEGDELHRPLWRNCAFRADHSEEGVYLATATTSAAILAYGVDSRGAALLARIPIAESEDFPPGVSASEILPAISTVKNDAEKAQEQQDLEAFVQACLKNGVLVTTGQRMEVVNRFRSRAEK